MEKLKIKKTGKSQFGFWLLVDDGSPKGHFRGCSEQVSGFLGGQLPCEIEVQASNPDEGNRKGAITNVKVISEKQNPNELDSPIEVEDMSGVPSNSRIVPASNYKPSVPNYSEIISDKDRQESIVTQFSIREGINLINSFNLNSDEKIKLTKGNIYTNAKIIKEVYEELIKGEEFQDY